jgi:hypothetical protein
MSRPFSLLTVLILLSWTQGWGQTAYLLRLDEGWQRMDPDSAKAAEVELPVREEALSQLELSYVFCAPDSVAGDSLYFYLEGVAWTAELILDSAYLGAQSRPFGPWIIPIPRSLLPPGTTHRLVLRLEDGASFDWHPTPFLGISQAPLLLQKDQLGPFQGAGMPLAREADTVAIVAPYYRSSAFVFDSLEAALNLLPLYKNGIQKVFFPFPAGHRLQRMCRELGFEEVKVLSDTQHICLINAYPYESRHFLTQERFWLDEQAYRTSSYGDAFRLGQKARREEPGLGLVFMILFPLLSAFLIKLSNPGFFLDQRAILFNPKLNLGGAIDLTASNTGLLGILILLKSLNLAIFLSLIVYYVLRENQWEQLNLLRDWSLLNQWFYGSENLWQIFQRSLLLVVLWFMLKNLLLSLVGWSYRVKSLVAGLMSLEVVAAFPMILFLGIPIALILFMPSIWGGWLIVLMLLLLSAYLLRKIYVFYIGLERLFTFSTAVKFLYICALNLMPYVIWL